MGVSLNHDEVVALYSYLKKREVELDKNVLKVLIKLEDYLYNKLTIKEIEELS